MSKFEYCAFHGGVHIPICRGAFLLHDAQTHRISVASQRVRGDAQELEFLVA